MPEQLQTRKATLPTTIDAAGLSVEAVAATETPVKVYSWERGLVNEIILVSGATVPSAGQIPLLDAHNRSTVGAVLGHAKGFSVVGNELHCQVCFDSTPEGQRAFEKVKTGSLTDFSLGYRVLESVWIPENETQTIDGRSFAGPVQIATKIEIKELSAVPIGADPNARARADSTLQTRGKNDMTPEEIRAEAIRLERERITEITAMCDHFEMPEMARGFIDGNTQLEEVRKAVMAKFIAKKNEQPMPGFSPPVDDVQRYHAGRDSSEKRADAVTDGFLIRAGMRLDRPAPGSDEYAATSFENLARECLQAAGINPRGMSAGRLFKIALSTRATVVGDLPNLLENIASKTLRLAYQQAPSTWRQWCRIGTAKDFKEMSRPILSEISDLDEIPEGTKYPHGEVLDSAEKFQIRSYGKIFSVSRQALINDDLGALTGIPQAWGAAAQRKVNSLVYEILTGNPVMADGKTLFHADHGNVGTGGAVSKSTLSEARSKMRLQKGPAGLATLNIVPKYLIAPAAIETIVDTVLSSISLDETNSGIANPFYKKFVQITEPLLDATDTTGWYLAADPSSIDTIEVCFLGGNEGPYIETQPGWNVDGLEIKCRIDVGAKALDYRGLVFNEGD